MPSVTVECVDVRQAGGKVYIKWDDGVEEEFSSLAQARADRDALLSEARGLARRFARCRYLQIDPNANNPQLLIGRSITLTNENNTMVTVV